MTDTTPVDHESVDPATREAVLNRDCHSCRFCGRGGLSDGGAVPLHVHHIERPPADMDEHDLDNLITLCRGCHNWHHQRSVDGELPVELTDADEQELLPHDKKILELLAEEGPATTGEIASRLDSDRSVMAIRERLWLLMGLDNIVEQRDRQLVDQAADTGEWGLVGQIATSARGRIPEDSQTLLKRAEDERVRQALARGCDRETVATVFDVVSRTTWHKERRAQAYEFPLAAIDGGETVEDHEETTEEDLTAADAQSGTATDGGSAEQSPATDTSEAPASEAEAETDDALPPTGAVVKLARRDESPAVLVTSVAPDQRCLQGVRVAHLADETVTRIAAADAPGELADVTAAVASAIDFERVYVPVELVDRIDLATLAPPLTDLDGSD